MSTGRWRVIPGTTTKGRRTWTVGRNEGGGIRFVLVTYSKQPRRWFVEQGARDYCAILIRAERLQLQLERQAKRARELATAWPFRESFHNWSTP